ncbi:putative isocitrate dehydrogenase, NAD-dependent [Ostertagia ostertagi]
MLSRLTPLAARPLSLSSVLASPSQNATASAIRTHKLPGERLQLAKYGGRHTVVALPGDGIGPEMMDHIRTIFQYSHSRNVELRTRLDLYANILHCVTIPTVPTRHRDIDISALIRRREYEGEYCLGLNTRHGQAIVESIKIVTRPCIERIARMAFEYAALNNRKKVTAVHKANIQKLGDGLFLQVVKEMAKSDYPQIEFESMIVDNACMQLVSRPQQFDVMLMPNLYGNIISNIACGLVGGPGLVSGMNIGENYAVFETGTRNTGTSLAGKDLANPTAFIRASVDMLRYLGCHQHADLISDALWKTLVEQRMHTRDIGGTHKASEVVQITLDNIASMRR